MTSVSRSEHPREDFKRDCFVSLNGEWDFAFDHHYGKIDNVCFDQKIIVPFAYQTPDSAINVTEKHDIVWYKKVFDIPDKMKGKRLFIHFGAVDYKADVFLNGSLIGSHTGGYLPFSFEITSLVKPAGNVLTVKATDYADPSQPRGKQYWKDVPDRCWYTPTTGIWQSVWLEGITGKKIEGFKITPDIDNACATVEITIENFDVSDQIVASVSYKGKSVRTLRQSLANRQDKIYIPLLEEDFIDEIHYWSPEWPNLYDITLTLISGGKEADSVTSYFGMRKISYDKDGRLLLNNRPYFLKLVLDQGYWPESGLTPPSDDAIRHDVIMTKKYGFNGARKHQKPEDPRYYYWCDVLGLITWGELPSAYQFGDAEVISLTRDMQEFILRDYNHPSIITWVPLNESWGVRKILSDSRQQSFGDAMYYLCKAMDPTRLVSGNDGWENVKTDIAAIHDYSQTSQLIHERFSQSALCQKETIYTAGRRFFANGHYYEGQPFIVTEYGGIALASQSKDGAWGYAKAEDDVDALISRYNDVTTAICSLPGIAGFCYTQLTDVYQEVNGLMDFNRNEKIPSERIAEINNRF